MVSEPDSVLCYSCGRENISACTLSCKLLQQSKAVCTEGTHTTIPKIFQTPLLNMQLSVKMKMVYRLLIYMWRYKEKHAGTSPPKSVLNRIPLMWTMLGCQLWTYPYSCPLKSSWSAIVGRWSYAAPCHIKRHLLIFACQCSVLCAGTDRLKFFVSSWQPFTQPGHVAIAF